MDKIQLSKMYEELPDQFGELTEEQVHDLRKVINRAWATISHRIYFDFVNYEPYKYTTIDDMLADYKKGFIKVNTTGNESKIWGEVYNLMFRAMHDYFHCVIEKGFTFDEEVEVYEKQRKHTVWFSDDPEIKKLLSQVLRSEITYQGAYKEVTGKFHIDQKLILKAPDA